MRRGMGSETGRVIEIVGIGSTATDVVGRNQERIKVGLRRDNGRKILMTRKVGKETFNFLFQGMEWMGWRLIEFRLGGKDPFGNMKRNVGFW